MSVFFPIKLVIGNQAVECTAVNFTIEHVFEQVEAALKERAGIDSICMKGVFITNCNNYINAFSQIMIN